MENTNNTDMNTETENKDLDGVNNNGTESKENNTDSITMSKTDYEKAIQSAEDKVRGKYSKTIKELEGKIAELSPVEKTEAELELEARIQKLEESEKAVKEKEKLLLFYESLTDKGIDKSLFEFIKEDSDVEKLSEVLGVIATNKAKDNGYIPKDHGSDETVSIEEYEKMNYSQKVEFMKNHPENYKRIQNQKKR